MSILVWLVIGLLVVLHFTLHVGFSIALAAPDLLTVALLVAARGLGMGGAATLGAILGFLEDSLSVLSFGANAVALAVVGAVASRTRDLFVGDSLLFGVSYLFLGKWLRDLVHWFAVGAELREPFVEAMVLRSGFASVYVAVVGLVILWATGITWDPSGKASR